MPARTPGITLFACVALTTALGAQAERAVTGVVMDSVSGKPVRSSVLYFDSDRVEYHGDRDGRFSIAGLSIADTVLVVRSIGYVPRTVGIPFSGSAGSFDVGEVYLKPVATKLDQIAVEAEEVRLHPQLADFYRRKQDALPGTFITRDDIRRSGARRTGEILQRSLKIQMDCPNVRVGDDACTARNMRGRDIRMARGGWTFDRCEMDIYVDAKRTSLKVDEIPLTWIAAIEVYGSPATTPTAFGVGRCGVIAIWTTGVRG